MSSSTSYATVFSSDYHTARTRFRSAVQKAGGRLEAYPIAALGPDDQELTIDVGTLGDRTPRRVIVLSSGLHGVEGFFGSAVQLAFLQRRISGQALPPAGALLLLHGLNPYGFAWLRRCNEENVDLNRNFLLPGEQFAGCPALYHRLDSLLNPASPPSRFEPFVLKALLAILRFGRRTLKEAVPVGQYEYPRGLFFGGKEPAETQQILRRRLPEWLGDAQDVLHIDFHTGLGRMGSWQLLVDAPRDAPRARWLCRHFGDQAVSASSSADGIAYPNRGIWEKWCQATFADRNYNFATAEFGTYSPVKVTAGLRAENRAYHYAAHDDPDYDWARRQLVKVFAPASPRWRDTVVRRGLEIVDRAIEAHLDER